MTVSYTHLDVYKRQAVVFLIGFKDITVAVQAEGFVKQPVTAFHVVAALRVVRLIPCAGEPAAVFQSGGKTELPGLGAVSYTHLRQGLMEYVDVVLSQDAGSKSACINALLKKGYCPDHVLMVGDCLLYTSRCV